MKREVPLATEQWSEQALVREPVLELAWELVLEVEQVWELVLELVLELDRRQEHPLQPLKHGLQPRLFPFRPLTQQHLETAPACLPSLSGLFFPLMYEASGSLPSPWC
jgi:hypothetical protein